jgi:hypothetical protein
MALSLIHTTEDAWISAATLSIHFQTQLIISAWICARIALFLFTRLIRINLVWLCALRDRMLKIQPISVYKDARWDLMPMIN